MTSPSYLLFFSVISDNDVTIYEQRFSDNLEDNLIFTLKSLVMGFKYAMDVNLTSISYLDYTIFFRKGPNFTLIFATQKLNTDEEFINKIITELQKSPSFNLFEEYAKSDIILEDEEIENTIKKILFNLSFHSDFSKIKTDLTG